MRRRGEEEEEKEREGGGGGGGEEGGGEGKGRREEKKERGEERRKRRRERRREEEEEKEKERGEGRGATSIKSNTLSTEIPNSKSNIPRYIVQKTGPFVRITYTTKQIIQLEVSMVYFCHQ